MKKIITLISFALIINTNIYVTYRNNDARLGDQLTGFLHAKWVSFKYKIPLLYIPFSYSDQLVLSDEEQYFCDKESLDKEARKRFNYLINFGSGHELDITKSFLNKLPYNYDYTYFTDLPIMHFQESLRKIDIANIVRGPSALYIIPYFPESLEEHMLMKHNHPYKKFNQRQLPLPYFKVDWDNKYFKKLIQELVYPKNISSLNLVNPPSDHYSIALHVRKSSGGFDLPLVCDVPKELRSLDQFYVDTGFPWKHPPDSYYIEQIKLVANEKKNKKIFIFMFTDDPNQEQLLEKYRGLINNPNIVWSCRTTENNHYTNVLDDLFSIALNFDCLIRGDSNLTIVADKIGTHSMTICPSAHDWINDELYITQAKVKRVSNDKTSYSYVECNSHKSS